MTHENTGYKRTGKLMATFFVAALAVMLIFMGRFYGMTASAEVVDSGTCGADLTWTLDDEGTLTIDGEGRMKDYDVWDHSVPWPSNDSSIKSVEIGDKVTSIGDYAFYCCFGLTSINIPHSVEYIGEYAFGSCQSLESIQLPGAVIGIGRSAFESCIRLTSIEIPSSVENIGVFAFENCNGVTKITVDSGNAVYDSRNGCNALIETKTNKLIFGCKNTVIPIDVTSIGDYAFDDCTGLTSIEIPSSVTSIGDYAFAYCTGLTSIEIPSSVTSIGDDAFSGCRGLTSISVDNGNTVYDSRDNCNAIIETETNTLILGCNNTVIPDGVTSIGSSAFEDCTGLTSIEIPSSVTSIGDGAFSGCSSLTSIELPDSVAYIGSDSFGGTPLYNKTENWEDGVLYFGKHLIQADRSLSGDYNIKPGTKTIAGNAFYDCTGLTNVTIPDGVAGIGRYAFDSCLGLTEITIPNSVTKIGRGAFADCTGLTKVNITDLAAWFGISFGSDLANPISHSHSLYLNGEMITDIVIPNGVTQIGDYALSGFYGLKSVEIPNSVTSIGEGSFSDCYQLSSIEIPNSVTSIGSYAFLQCVGLKSINVPSSVKSIGEEAFEVTPGLASITVDSENAVYTDGDGSNAIIEKESNTLIVGCKNTIIPNGVTSIGDYAFYGCFGLTSIEIPNGVTSIGNYAFADCLSFDKVLGNGYAEEVLDIPGLAEQLLTDCTGLANVKISNTVTTIGYRAFGSCMDLTNIDIPNSVTSIGDSAFWGCISLTSAMIPNSVTEIGDYVFHFCDSLSSIVIPVSVEEIGIEAIPEDTMIYCCAGSCAHNWAVNNDRAFILLEGADITLSAPATVNTAVVPLYGFTTPGANVCITIDGAEAKTVTAAASGKWVTDITLPAPQSGKSYAVKATVTVNKDTAEKTATVLYQPDAVLVDSFELYHSYYTLKKAADNPSKSVPNFTFVPGKPLTFTVKASNNDRIAEMYVVSTKGGESKKMKLSYNAATDSWYATGFFDTEDTNYVPGTISVEMTDKDGNTTDIFTIIIHFLVDPSGFIYEAVSSNKVEGATAVVYYKDAEGHDLVWNAEPFEQINPVTTLADGAFAWVVPEGKWQVRVIKDGYEAGRSEWMDVPPEYTNVYIPLVSYAEPEVEAVTACEDYIDITFSQYMDITSVDTTNVTVDGYTFSIAPLDKTETLPGSGVFYAKMFRCTPVEGTFSGEIELTVKNAKNYAGTPLSDYTVKKTVSAKISELKAAATVTGNAGSEIIIEIEAENAAGMTVTAKTGSAILHVNESSIVLDANGKGQFTVIGAVPGIAEVEFALAGTQLTAATAVTVCEVGHTHTFDQQVATAAYLATQATCQKAAAYYTSCACGLASKGQTGETTFASGTTVAHDFGAWQTVTASTCTVKGTEERVCTMCKTEKETRELALAQHTKVTDAAIAATCTKTGLTEGAHCSVCKEVIVAQKTVPMLSHEDGNSDGKCDTCGKDLGTKPAQDDDNKDNGKSKSFIDVIRDFFKKIMDWFKSLFKI